MHPAFQQQKRDNPHSSNPGQQHTTSNNMYNNSMTTIDNHSKNDAHQDNSSHSHQMQTIDRCADDNIMALTKNQTNKSVCTYQMEATGPHSVDEDDDTDSEEIDLTSGGCIDFSNNNKC